MQQELKNLAKGIKNNGTVIGNFDEKELALRESAKWFQEIQKIQP
jgi:hypothetical protein